MNKDIDTLVYWFDGYKPTPPDMEVFFKECQGKGYKCIRDKEFVKSCFKDSYHPNEHHCKLEYHYDKVLKQYASFLKIPFTESDFFKQKYTDKGFDLKYLIPKNSHKYSIDVFSSKNGNIKKHYDGDFSQIVNFDKHCDFMVYDTGYHRLFVGSHSFFHMKNQTINDDAPKVLIVGDSQTVPIIPILCNYCKELVYVDVRCINSRLQNIVKSINFNKRIIQLYNDKPIKWWKKYV